MLKLDSCPIRFSDWWKVTAKRWRDSGRILSPLFAAAISGLRRAAQPCAPALLKVRDGFFIGLALLPVAGIAVARKDDPTALRRPADTADTVLNGENQSWDRHLSGRLSLPGWIDLAVDQRTRFEFLEEPFRPGEPDSQAQFPQRTRLRLGLDVPGPARFLAELQDSRTWNDGPQDFTRNGIDKLDILQLFVSATLPDLFGAGLRGDLHAGRLTLDLGSRRLVARNRFRNTTNAFDGLHLQIEGARADWRVRGFYTRPVLREEGAFDNRAWSSARFWGLAYEHRRVEWLQIDAAYLDLADGDNSSRLHTFDLRLHRVAAARQVDYELELMGQFGDVGLKDQSAFATHVELGYTFDAPWLPRIAAQFDYASGTDDPAGERNHTFLPLFGARRFDLVPTGIFGPFVRSNIRSRGLRAGLAPMQRLRIDLKLAYWQLAEAQGAFVGGGVQDPTGSAGRDLGTDVELRVRWDPLSWVGFDLGYDHWFKGAYLEQVPEVSSTADSNYFYLATRLRF